MNASEDRKLDRLLDLIAATRDDEITCDECLDDLARFVETELEQPVAAGTRDEVFTAIRRHLDDCPECAEEHETLREALRALAEEPPSDRTGP